MTDSKWSSAIRTQLAKIAGTPSGVFVLLTALCTIAIAHEALTGTNTVFVIMLSTQLLLAVGYGRLHTRLVRLEDRKLDVNLEVRLTPVGLTPKKTAQPPDRPN